MVGERLYCPQPPSGWPASDITPGQASAGRAVEVLGELRERRAAIPEEIEEDSAFVEVPGAPGRRCRSSAC